MVSVIFDTVAPIRETVTNAAEWTVRRSSGMFLVRVADPARARPSIIAQSRFDWRHMDLDQAADWGDYFLISHSPTSS
jgi:hypothetical protein